MNYVDTFADEEEIEGPIVNLEDYKPEYLFVYGTLMRTEGNHQVMPIQAVYLGDAFTQPGFVLLDVGLPAMMADPEGVGVVEGEVYEVNKEILQRLDRFEGHPSFYRRERIKLQGAVPEAWAYLREVAYGHILPSPATWKKRKEA